ncbi:aspartate aminotransferase family protein [Prauserella marina]|uniref:aspartate aminotransferase family protein n=1 Tax=Prauserella marina TaxID=530584 RepID=UPI001C40B47C|nr:aminotransferase class III-fold pyridoxal phosphate-dependent enzyme [Prauserella marina]
MENALRLAQHAQGRRRRGVAYATNSFHGKTRGALSVTDSPLCRATVRLPQGGVRVPFGDVAALAGLLRRDRSIGTVILEPVQGGAGIVVPPPGYLAAVRQLCDKHDVLWIADEVQSGCGRTGRFFAFEHEDVVPDIVTLAKSLGGGKAAIAATICTRAVARRAHRGSAALHHTPGTFAGTGEACATAITALNVLYDEGLLDNARIIGAYLTGELEALARRHPGLIAEVRGKGLMIGLEFTGAARAGLRALGPVASAMDRALPGGLAVAVGSLLKSEHSVLVGFTDYNRNVLRLQPPLGIEHKHVDQLVAALDDLLSRGALRLGADFLRTGRAPRAPGGACDAPGTPGAHRPRTPERTGSEQRAPGAPFSGERVRRRAAHPGARAAAP